MLVALGAAAQKARRMTPVYFISGELTSADSFNRFLAPAIPDFQLKSVDSAKDKWDFNFTAGKKTLTISYYLETSYSFGASNSELKKTKKQNISHIECRSDLPTLVLLYNKVFKKTNTAEDIKGEMPIRGPIWYGYNDYVWNKNNYWFTFADFKPDGGLVLMFHKVK